MPDFLASSAAFGVDSTAYACACGLMRHRLSWYPIFGPWWQDPQTKAPTYFGPGAVEGFGSSAAFAGPFAPFEGWSPIEAHWSSSSGLRWASTSQALSTSRAGFWCTATCEPLT